MKSLMVQLFTVLVVLTALTVCQIVNGTLKMNYFILFCTDWAVFRYPNQLKYLSYSEENVQILSRVDKLQIYLSIFKGTAIYSQHLKLWSQKTTF